VIPENSYLAIAFGYSMIDTDMILWQADEQEVKVKDLWATEFE
jgi:hypothetical protein